MSLAVTLHRPMDEARNVTEQEDGHDPGLWNLDYLIVCFAESKICVSFGLWLLSCLFWFTSFSLNFYLRCKRKSKYEESIFWNIFSFFGSMCNTIGALLSKQLTIQVFTGAYLAFSDVIDFILALFPVCNSSYRLQSRQNVRSKRKRKPILSALSLCTMISLWCFSAQDYDYSDPKLTYVPKRRLLGTVLQESTDVVGFTLGIIAVLVSWTVRVPTITNVAKGSVLPVIRIWAVFFSILASIMYAAAIMSHDRHPEYFVRAIPWILLSLGAAALDIALIILSCIMKSRRMFLVRNAALKTERRDLLANSGESELEPESFGKPENLHWTPLNMVPKRNNHKRATMGRYVTLSIEHVQEGGIGTVRMPGDGQTHPGTLYNEEPVYYLDLAENSATRIIHFSSSSSDRSSNTNDLEWDFEDLDQSWNVDSDVSSIQASDSSVLHSVSLDSAQQISPTHWTTLKNTESAKIKKKNNKDSKKRTSQ